MYACSRRNGVKVCADSNIDRTVEDDSKATDKITSFDNTEKKIQNRRNCAHIRKNFNSMNGKLECLFSQNDADLMTIRLTNSREL